MSDGTIPLIGDEFPHMTVHTTLGPMRLPDDFAGRWFILFSHPADFTPVCTTEFVAFQKRYDEFRKLDCELIGLSIDQVYSHLKWIEWIREKLSVEIKFPVIADDMGRVAARLGLVHERKGTNTVRGVFITDANGLIRALFYYPQELGRSIDEILRIVRAFQTSDSEGVAMPENWPNNELIGNHVILPPPSDASAAAQRRGQGDCLDWWFCHREP